MTSGPTIEATPPAQRVARAVEARNGCPAGCTACAATAAVLLATSALVPQPGR